MEYSFLLAALIVVSLSGCGNKTAETPASSAPAPQTSATAPAASLPAGHPPVDTARMIQSAPVPPLTQKARVLSTIDVTQYTYLEVRQDNNTRWLATTTSSAKKGDTIQFDDGTIMTNFYSKMLNRTFPSITFVGRVVISNEKS